MWRRAIGMPPISLPGVASGALALSAALAWNDAVKASLASYLKPREPSSLKIVVAYAIVMTLLVILVAEVINATSRVYNHLKTQFAGDPDEVGQEFARPV